MRIGTHSGTFHCDEAFACYLLKLTNTFKDAEIIRSRDPQVLDELDILVDVGGVYDPEKMRFDHHQRGFNETISKGFKTKLSSAGLIYKHFGKEIIGNIVGGSDETNELVYWKAYKNFVEAIDGVDNGISQYPSDLTPAYTSRTDISSRVGNLNSPWNKEYDDEKTMEQFKKGMEMVGSEFVAAVESLRDSWLPARDIVMAAVQNRQNIYETGEILVFDQHTAWKGHLMDIEEEMKLGDQIKYVIYQDNSGKWRVQAVPVSPNSFVSRKALPEPWRGIRDAELDALSGIPGCIFVHASGFIGGNNTREGAIQMAIDSLVKF